MLEVHKGVTRELVHEDRSVVISLLRQFALQLGDKTWSVGLQLVYGDDLSRSCSYFRGPFVISLDPPWTVCQLPVLTRCAKGFLASKQALGHDRIPSTTPGAEPPRDDRDSGSARSHSTHLETSSSDRPKMVTYTEPQTVSSYMSVECTRRTLRMPIFTRATHAQPSLSNFPWRDSEFWRADPLTRDDPGGTKFSHFPPK